MNLSFFIPFVFAIFAWSFVIAINNALDIILIDLLGLDNINLTDQKTIFYNSAKKWIILALIYLTTIIILAWFFNFNFFRIYGIDVTNTIWDYKTKL